MPSVEDYTIGCICALSTEAVALRLFLDEEHECPEIPSAHVSSQDRNVYTTGSVRGHKIVVATLPFGKYGISQATSVIGDMIRSFPNLRCCFMVGIGGGAPSSQHDIRLGDVVVSAPVHKNGGILQYDHGKAIQGQQFRIGQHLNEPPRFLLSAVGKLAQDYEMEGHPLQDMVNDILAQKPRLKSKYQQPGGSSDQLYKSSVVHPTDVAGKCENTCGNETSKLVERSQRAAGPGVAEIFDGVIASGSSLMKDALLRDRLSKEEDVLCFEMEAAGLVNQFPCLVIRGICDYSDSHKNDDWQGYAAMMAAAYTKEILRVLAPGKVHSAEKVVDRLGDKLSDIAKNVQQLTVCHQDTRDDATRIKVLKWIPSVDYTERQNALQRERYEGTGQWFLDTCEFKKWLHQAGSILFCPGFPGAGKTHIASLVIHHLQTSKPTPGLAYIYCEYTQQSGREVLLGSLLEQLVRPQHPLPDRLLTLYEIHRDNNTQPTLNETSAVLRHVAAEYERCFIIVDGLDECTNDEGEREFLLTVLIELQQSSKANILALSRDNEHIKHHLNTGICAQIRIKAPNDDIDRYLDHRISRVLPFLADDMAVCRHIKTVIMKAASGMFLLAMLHFNSLKGKVNIRFIMDALAELESGGTSLMGAYDKTMKMIESQQEGFRKLAKDTLSWVAFSSRPLRVRELQQLLAIELGKPDLDPRNMSPLDVIVSTCAGLITIQGGRHHATAHLVHETTQEYFNNTRQRWFGNVRPRLARLCLTYLTFRTFESGPCRTHEEFNERRNRYPLVEYFRQSFQDYIKGNDEDARVKILLENFFLSDMHIQAYIQARESYIGQSTALHLAIYYHIHSLIPRLVFKHCNDHDRHGHTPLQFAVLLRCHEAIESLISAIEVNCNATASDKRTALSFACELGDENTVRLLLNGGQVDVNLADKKGWTPLCYALVKKQSTVVRLLLLERKDIDCTTPDRKGLVPLFHAARSGCEISIRELLARPEVEVNTILINDITVLHWAIQKNKMSTYKYILEQPGLDINMKDHQQRTPIICCVARRSYEMTMLMLAREDVDLGVLDKNGQGLLIWTAKWGQVDVMHKVLDEINPQILTTDVFRRNSLDYAAESEHWEVVRLLLRNCKTKIRMQHGFDETALFYAIKKKNPDIVTLLMAHIDVNEGDWPISALALSMEIDMQECFLSLTTALQDWMQSHPEWVIACLLRVAEKGVDHLLNSMLKTLRRDIDETKSEQGDSADIRNWDDISILTIVFETPSKQIDARDRQGRTALHSAARRGDVAAVRLLLAMGANRNVEDSAGYIAAEGANNGPGHLKAVRMILNPSGIEDSQPRDAG